MAAITVFGYGSLLSERSARSTVADLRRFRLVELAGFKRIFNKVGVVFIQRWGIPADGLSMASCSTRKSSTNTIICSAFECNDEEFSALYEREHRFQWIDAEACERDGSRVTGRMCTEYNDHDYRYKKCRSEQEYRQRVGQFYEQQLWRDDILPHPIYLRHCLQAAREHGRHVEDNFLDHSFIADGKTNVRSFLQHYPDFLLSADDTVY